jgi:hypothetical protein
MRNPFYIRYMGQLVDIFCEVDSAADKIKRAGVTAERWQLAELDERLQTLLPIVDTMPLPGSARRAGRDVGDFVYLFAALTNTALEQTKEEDLPTVRETEKYGANPFNVSVALDSDTFNQILLFRAKARETLAGPASRYGLSVDNIFVPQDA